MNPGRARMMQKHHRQHVSILHYTQPVFQVTIGWKQFTQYDETLFIKQYNKTESKNSSFLQYCSTNNTTLTHHYRGNLSKDEAKTSRWPPGG